MRFRKITLTFELEGKPRSLYPRELSFPCGVFTPIVGFGLHPPPPLLGSAAEAVPRGEQNQNQEDLLLSHPEDSGASEVTVTPARSKRAGSASPAAVSSGTRHFGVGTGRTVTFWPSFLVPDLPARAGHGLEHVSRD